MQILVDQSFACATIVAMITSPNDVAQCRETMLIKDIKVAARQALRANLAMCAVVALIISTLVFSAMTPSATATSSYDLLRSLFASWRWSTGEQMLTGLAATVKQIQSATSIGSDSSQGVISSLYGSAKDQGGLINALVEAINHWLFRGGLSASLIAVGIIVTTIAAFLLLQSPIRVSGARFFLETRLYPGTSLTRLLFIFRHRKTLAIAKATCYHLLWLIIWLPTVVMVPVKYYSYWLFDLIMAESPNTSPQAALRLSQEMMKGQRWRAFRLDMSFLPWYFLGLLTFGIVTYFYASPYHSLAQAEFYARRRQLYFANAHPRVVFLTDPYLLSTPTVAGLLRDGVDPLAIEPVAPHSKTLLAEGFRADNLPLNSYPDADALRTREHLDYRRSYSLLNLLLLFFCFSMIGWLYESISSIAYVGHFVNRGTLWGPWLPVYGCGGVAALILLRRWRDRPGLIFALSMLVCGIIEYVGATVLWELFGLKYWDYQGYFFNIQGRVCLEGLLVFGLGCCAVVYFLAPLLDALLNHLPWTIRMTFAAILTAGFLIDCGFSFARPRTGEGLTTGD
ncbi:MAG: DUF975 family protein [Propionibacteriaceae bacterium]|jgi:uncharacterized membrane protein|nr:DUF975 family protein [Propionibacteriaceae bacterium]